MIDLSRTKARAVADLKHYLDYADRGPRALAEAVRAAGHDDYDSDFELAVAEHLRRRGWEVRTQVGVSKFRIDLGVVHPDAPGRFLAGVECDGATYHRSPTARDRDRVRHIVLENLGWRLHRVWSTDFFIDERQEMDVLDANLRALLEADRAAAEAKADLPATDTWEAEEAPPADLEDDPEIEDAEAEDADSAMHPPPSVQPEHDAMRFLGLAGTADPQAADAGPFLEPERFYDDDYQPTLRELAASIIDAEGPVVFRLLSERIARSHEFARTGKKIKKIAWRACNRVRVTTRTPDEHVVFWPQGVEPATVIRFRGLRNRQWADVPHPEKVGLVQSFGTTAVDQVVRQVAQAAGVARITERLRTEVVALLEHRA